MSAIQALLTESIDYAGLFPPAGLDMSSAVENYARYQNDPAAWALGRFVLPVSRLREFDKEADTYFPEIPTTQPWRLALLPGSDLAGDLDSITDFNRRHAVPKPSLIADTIEVKATSVGGIEDIMHRVPRSLQVYIEIPIDREPRSLLAAIGKQGGRAKVRTGGVTAQAFPTTGELIRFLRGCRDANLPFKATAGLHHPLRAQYRLTYAPDSPSGVMFGFLNLFLANAFLRTGMGEAEAVRLLEEASPDAFQFDDAGVTWEGHRIGLEELREARRLGLVSFGSCSFTEPIGDLQALHLLGSGAQHS